MSAEQQQQQQQQQQDQRPKSSASSKKSAASRKSSDEQRGHQLSDDGPAPAAAAAPDAYQQLSDDQPESGADGEKAEKPKKENPLKKFIASLKSLSCTGKPANLDKKGSASQEEEDENTPNARPVSQSSLESKKVVTEKSAPQIDVSPAVEDSDKKEGDKKEDGEKDEGKIASPVEPAVNAPLTTTVISATPPTL